MRTEVIIRATRTQNVLGEKGRDPRADVGGAEGWNFAENWSSSTPRRSPTAACAVAQCESLRYKLIGGLAAPPRYGVVRFKMESARRAWRRSSRARFAARAPSR